MIDNNANEQGNLLPNEDRRVERVTPDGIQTVYANNVLIQMSIWDVTMNFSRITEASQDTLRFEDLVSVIMSPQQAKAFARALSDSVTQYEERFGVLPTNLDK